MNICKLLSARRDFRVAGLARSGLDGAHVNFHLLPLGWPWRRTKGFEHFKFFGEVVVVRICFEGTERTGN